MQPKYRTYGQFRGYSDVITLTGDGANDPQAKFETVYYRGMSRDNNTTAVTLTDSAGGQHDDTDQLSGNVLETTAYLGNGGPVDHSTVTSYWVSAPTATRSRSGLPALTANWVAPAETYTRQAVTTGAASLADVCAAEELCLAVDSMQYVSRWITPEGSPRRFDTRFFVCTAPERQTPLHDATETISHEWVRPGDVLRPCSQAASEELT